MSPIDPRCESRKLGHPRDVLPGGAAAVDDEVRELRAGVDRTDLDARPAREVRDDVARLALLVALVDAERRERRAAVGSGGRENFGHIARLH